MTTQTLKAPTSVGAFLLVVGGTLNTVAVVWG